MPDSGEEQGTQTVRVNPQHVSIATMGRNQGSAAGPACPALPPKLDGLEGIT